MTKDDVCPFDYRLNRVPYLVIPKLALQAMPVDWRRRLEALLDEADATGLACPNYIVLRAEPHFTKTVLEDEGDPYGPVDHYDVVQVDPWANYRHADIDRVRELCPGFDPGKKTP